MKPAVYLFDLDGTLISAHGAGRRALEKAVPEVLGRAVPLEFSFAGGTDRGIARQALHDAGVEPTEEAIDELLSAYLQELSPALQATEEYTVFAGVRELLDELRPRPGLAIGLGTGNLEAAARMKLNRSGLNDYFPFGGFGCDAEARDELLRAGARRGAARLGVAPEDCRIVVIGDTLRDVAAASAIGAECLAVATGFTPRDELLTSAPTYCVADLTAPLVRDVLNQR